MQKSVPDKSEEIMTLGQGKLIEILKNREAPLFDKAKACQRLAVVGTREAVPALAALLPDPQLSHYARYGLQPIPDPSVDDALRSAMEKLKGGLKVGVINSIGWRRDAQATSALAKLLDDKDSAVAAATAAALGRIGGLEAANTLQQALRRSKAPLLPAVAGACLVCAEGLLAQGKREQALALYSALSGPDIPKPVREAAKFAR